MAGIRRSSTFPPGGAAPHAGRAAEVRVLLEQALPIQRKMSNPRYEGIALVQLAQLHHEAGDSEEALPLFEQALPAQAEQGRAG